MATFNASEVKKAAVEEKKERSIPPQKEGQSQSKKQSHPNELSEYRRMMVVRWYGKSGERGTVSRIGK